MSEEIYDRKGNLVTCKPHYRPRKEGNGRCLLGMVEDCIVERSDNGLCYDTCLKRRDLEKMFGLYNKFKV